MGSFALIMFNVIFEIRPQVVWEGEGGNFCSLTEIANSLLFLHCSKLLPSFAVWIYILGGYNFSDNAKYILLLSLCVSLRFSSLSCE
jgi:hypothetical protein